MEFGIEKGVMLMMRSWKRQMTEGIELPIKEKIRSLEEKETYRNLGFKAETIKQTKMKDKIKKNISGEREKCSISSYSAEGIKT